MRKLLTTAIFTLVALAAQPNRAFAGDNQCVVNLYVRVMHPDGTYTLNSHVTSGETLQQTIILGPGDYVEIRRDPAGALYCFGDDRLLVRANAGPGYASPADPILDTLSFTAPVQWTDTGSFYFVGCTISPSAYMVGSAFLQLNIVAAPLTNTTAISEVQEDVLHVSYTDDGLLITNAHPGELTVLDIAGRAIWRGHLAVNGSTPEAVALPSLPTGIYTSVLLTDYGIYRGRFYHP